MSLAPGSSTLPDLFWDRRIGEEFRLLLKDSMVIPYSPGLGCNLLCQILFLSSCLNTSDKSTCPLLDKRHREVPGLPNT